jgi:hypothetical protein
MQYFVNGGVQWAANGLNCVHAALLAEVYYMVEQQQNSRFNPSGGFKSTHSRGMDLATF